MNSIHKITLEIPEEIFAGICEFRKISNIPDEESAVFELLKYALSLPAYFRDFDWQKAEEEADEEIAAGKVKNFSSSDEFLSDLNA